MIPKIIHYCWFGNNDLPELEQMCLKSWKDKLPDYQIMRWDESNSNLTECDYVCQAYEKKKYAFVSDYVRINTLYKYGGIYLDTDVEVLKSFNPFLTETGFLGFENRTTVGTAVMACEKGADFARRMIEYYRSHPFIDNLGNINLTTNVTILNSILEEKGMKRENKNQVIDSIKIMQRDFFYPKKVSEEEFFATENTFCIHRMKGSWLTDRQKKRGSNKFWINVCRPILRKFQQVTLFLFGEQTMKKIELWVRNKMQ